MGMTLARAMVHWRRGEPIPVDLAMKFAGEGYDVPTLERKHTP